MLEGVIFDIDGTLVDSKDAHAQSWVDTFAAIVVTLGAWNWRRVRPSLGDDGSELTIRRSATMELTFAALVLLVTSVLVTLPSPK